jgi:hypothetical protein
METREQNETRKRSWKRKKHKRKKREKGVSGVRENIRGRSKKRITKAGKKRVLVGNLKKEIGVGG